MWWVGILLACAYSRACLPRHAKGTPALAPTVPDYIYQGSIVIAIDDNDAFHVHHWMLLMPLLFAPLPAWLQCFVATLIVQGLACYSDRCDCFVANPYCAPPPALDDWV